MTKKQKKEEKKRRELSRKRCSPGCYHNCIFWLHFAHVSAAIKNERKSRGGGKLGWEGNLANYEDLDKPLAFLAACPEVQFSGHFVFFGLSTFSISFRFYV